MVTPVFYIFFSTMSIPQLNVIVIRTSLNYRNCLFGLVAQKVFGTDCHRSFLLCLVFL